MSTLTENFFKKLCIMKTYIKNSLISLLSLSLLSCSAGGTSSNQTNANITPTAQALTINNTATIPVFPDSATTSVIYIHNNSNQPISNIDYSIINNNDSVNDATNNFLINADSCKKINANSRCAITFTTPVLSGANTQGSVVLVAKYGENTFSQIINYGQILDNSTPGVIVNSGVSILNWGNSTGYATLYAYAGANQSYLLQDLTTNNKSVGVVDNLASTIISNNTIIPIEVKSSSSVNAEILLNISSNRSSYSFGGNVMITSAPQPSSPLLVSGLTPIINTAKTSTGSFLIINAGNQSATLSNITYSDGIESVTETDACGAILPSYSSCKIYFKVPESGTSGSINIQYNGGTLIQAISWYNGNSSGALMAMSSNPGSIAITQESYATTLVTVKNIGSYSLNNLIPSAIIVSGNGIATVDSNSCNATLAVGSSCAFVIKVTDFTLESNKQINLSISGQYNNGNGTITYSRILATTYTVVAGEFAYVVNTSGNSISMFKKLTNGQLIALSPATISTGNSPKAIVFDPSGKYAYVPNLLSNTISIYSRSTNGLLTSLTTMTLPSGITKPSNIYFDVSKKYVYITAAGATTPAVILMYSFNSSNGQLTSLNPGSITILNNGNDGHLVFDPSGQFVYATGYNTSSNNSGIISMFSESANGQLVPLSPATTTTPGKMPSEFTIDPSGQYMYVPINTMGNNYAISMFSKSANGQLSQLSPNLSGTAGSPITDIVCDPSGQYVYASSSNNAINQFSKSINGQLTALIPAAITSIKSPTSITFDPTGQYFYATSEDNIIYMFKFNANGQLAALSQATVPTESNPTSIVFK